MCNPSRSVSITGEDIAALGLVADPNGHMLTRIRMRYAPVQAATDLILSGSGFYEGVVTAHPDDANAVCIPLLCDDIPAGGLPDEDGGTGDDSEDVGGSGEGAPEGGGGDDEAGTDAAEGRACGADASGAGLPTASATLAPAAGLALLRRRRP